MQGVKIHEGVRMYGVGDHLLKKEGEMERYTTVR